MLKNCSSFFVRSRIFSGLNPFPLDNLIPIKTEISLNASLVPVQIRMFGVTHGNPFLRAHKKSKNNSPRRGTKHGYKKNYALSNHNGLLKRIRIVKNFRRQND